MAEGGHLVGGPVRPARSTASLVKTTPSPKPSTSLLILILILVLIFVLLLVLILVLILVLTLVLTLVILVVIIFSPRDEISNKIKVVSTIFNLQLWKFHMWINNK